MGILVFHTAPAVGEARLDRTFLIGSDHLARECGAVRRIDLIIRLIQHMGAKRENTVPEGILYQILLGILRRGLGGGLRCGLGGRLLLFKERLYRQIADTVAVTLVVEDAAPAVGICLLHIALGVGGNAVTVLRRTVRIVYRRIMDGVHVRRELAVIGGIMDSAVIAGIAVIPVADIQIDGSGSRTDAVVIARLGILPYIVGIAEIRGIAVIGIACEPEIVAACADHVGIQIIGIPVEIRIESRMVSGSVDHVHRFDDVLGEHGLALTLCDGSQRIVLGVDIDGHVKALALDRAEIQLNGREKLLAAACGNPGIAADLESDIACLRVVVVEILVRCIRRRGTRELSGTEHDKAHVIVSGKARPVHDALIPGDIHAVFPEAVSTGGKRCQNRKCQKQHRQRHGCGTFGDRMHDFTS